MTDDADTSRVGRVLGRRRRKNEPGGRQHKHEVWVSPKEEALLLALATAQGVTIPRLLVEAALAGDQVAAGERRQLAAEFFAAKRVLSGLATNVNQIAKTANSTSEVPAETGVTLAAVRRLAERIEQALSSLGQETAQARRRGERQ